MNKTLQHINLRRYLPFFLPCSEKNNALAIYNKYGAQQMLECSGSSEQIIHLLHLISNQHPIWDTIDSEITYPLGKQGYFQVAPLTIGASEQQYWLTGIQLTDSNMPLDQQTRNINQLHHIAQCLEEDYTQAETINGLADELSIRYEELNLLYGIDDSDSYFKNHDEQESLTQLLSNCVDFLNIDLAIIFLPELEICLHQTTSLTSKTQDLLLNIVNQQIYPYMEKHPDTLVINRDQDSDWTDANLKIPYKIIVSPIIKSNNQLNGILVLINELQKTDFSNSDRKLGEIIAAEASKITQARRDNITGQLNRRGLTEKLDKLIALNKTNTQPVCLLLINIDQFKVINDTAGQTGGDHLLKQVNSLIWKTVKKTDHLGRLGADEYAVILNDCSLSNAEGVAEKIRLIIKQYRYFYQDKLFDISACVGVVELTDEIDNFSEALRTADLACSLAKEEGRNRIHVFKKNDENLLTHENQMQWVSRINIGIEENSFQIYRQKILPLQAPESVDHYEILLRLKDTNGDIISPFHFIPAAERYNLMTKLDQWVVKTTLAKLAFIEETEPHNNFSCSINLSGQSFCEDGFSSFVIEQIEQSGIPPQSICFEITETAAVSNLVQTIEFMEKLKTIGCQFSLDDFGSGMSSFTYLKNLPVDYLKIDGYFVKTMLENEIDKAMVSSIHQIGNVMGLKTIAEFVENDAILDELKIMGIDYGQGYGIGRPEPF